VPPGALAGFPPLAAFGAFLAGLAFFVDLAFADAPLAACALPLALRSAFGLSGSPRR
jgi:hypothetical protein